LLTVSKDDMLFSLCDEWIIDLLTYLICIVMKLFCKFISFLWNHVMNPRKVLLFDIFNYSYPDSTLCNNTDNIAMELILKTSLYAHITHQSGVKNSISVWIFCRCIFTRERAFFFNLHEAMNIPDVWVLIGLPAIL
jgi:hypothetical protein